MLTPIKGRARSNAHGDSVLDRQNETANLGPDISVIHADDHGDKSGLDLLRSFVQDDLGVLSPAQGLASFQPQPLHVVSASGPSGLLGAPTVAVDHSSGAGAIVADPSTRPAGKKRRGGVYVPRPPFTPEHVKALYGYGSVGPLDPDHPMPEAVQHAPQAGSGGAGRAFGGIVSGSLSEEALAELAVSHALSLPPVRLVSGGVTVSASRGAQGGAGEDAVEDASLYEPTPAVRVLAQVFEAEAQAQAQEEAAAAAASVVSSPTRADANRTGAGNKTPWLSAVSPEGKTYYYHKLTREACWELPAGVSPADVPRTRWKQRDGGREGEAHGAWGSSLAAQRLLGPGLPSHHGPEARFGKARAAQTSCGPNLALPEGGPLFLSPGMVLPQPSMPMSPSAGGLGVGEASLGQADAMMGSYSSSRDYLRSLLVQERSARRSAGNTPGGGRRRAGRGEADGDGTSITASASALHAALSPLLALRDFSALVPTVTGASAAGSATGLLAPVARNLGAMLDDAASATGVDYDEDGQEVRPVVNAPDPTPAALLEPHSVYKQYDFSIHDEEEEEEKVDRQGPEQHDVEAGDPSDPEARSPCPDCGRSFHPSRLPIHSKSCIAVWGTRRSPFPTAAVRVRDTPASSMNFTARTVPPCAHCGRKFPVESDAREHGLACKKRPHGSAGSSRCRSRSSNASGLAWVGAGPGQGQGLDTSVCSAILGGPLDSTTASYVSHSYSASRHGVGGRPLPVPVTPRTVAVRRHLPFVSPPGPGQGRGHDTTISEKSDPDTSGSTASVNALAQPARSGPPPRVPNASHAGMAVRNGHVPAAPAPVFSPSDPTPVSRGNDGPGSRPAAPPQPFLALLKRKLRGAADRAVMGTTRDVPLPRAEVRQQEEPAPVPVAHHASKWAQAMDTVSPPLLPSDAWSSPSPEALRGSPRPAGCTCGGCGHTLADSSALVDHLAVCEGWSRRLASAKESDPQPSSGGEGAVKQGAGSTRIPYPNTSRRAVNSMRSPAAPAVARALFVSPTQQVQTGKIPAEYSARGVLGLPLTSPETSDPGAPSSAPVHQSRLQALAVAAEAAAKNAWAQAEHAKAAAALVGELQAVAGVKGPKARSGTTRIQATLQLN